MAYSLSKEHKILLSLLGTLAVVAVVTIGVYSSSDQSNFEGPRFLQEYNYYQVLFHQWRIRHKKNYVTHQEAAERFNIWLANYENVEDHNSNPNNTFKLGMYEYSDLTHEEMRAKRHPCLNMKNHKKLNVVQSHPINISDLPKSVDWRDTGAVAAVKNQQSCGSCWAFSTTGALEGLQYISTGKLIPLSEQQLVDCSFSFGNEGCNGGLMDDAFNYTKQYGLESESLYPYLASTGNCHYDKTKVSFKNTGFEDVPSNDEVALMAAVAKQPVSIGIEADSLAFQMYSGGILNSASCGTNLDHGVLLVGYGTEDGKDFWIVKNSWGPEWGENGYIRMARSNSRNSTGMCGIAMAASYPTKSNDNPRAEDIIFA